MKYIVYKTTNKINNKIYIGVHITKNPNIFDGYIGCGMSRKHKHNTTNKKGFPAAVEKYGYDNFSRETLYIFDDTEEGHDLAYKKEAELVTEDFIKRDDTYNLALGGKFTVYENIKKPIIQYSLNGKFIQLWDSITEAENVLNLNSIGNAVNGRSKYAGNYQWRFYKGNIDNIEPIKTKEKTTYQFDLQGNLIKVWKSIMEAANTFNNPKSAKVAIANCCRGESTQSFGYYWSYVCKFESKKNNHLASVAKYNDEGEFIESYSSLKEAAIANNIKVCGNIIAAIKGSQKRCGGFRWRYFYGNTSNIKPL